MPFDRLTLISHSGSSDCVGGIIGEDIGGNMAVVGDEFMKNVYSVFDFDKKAVGFAAIGN